MRLLPGGAEGPEVRVKDEIAQLHQSVPRAAEAALQQQQNTTAVAVDHQDSREKP